MLASYYQLLANCYRLLSIADLLLVYFSSNARLLLARVCNACQTEKSFVTTAFKLKLTNIFYIS